MKAIAIAFVLLAPLVAHAVIVCGDGLSESNLADDTSFVAPAFDDFHVMKGNSQGDLPGNILMWFLVGQEARPRLGYFDVASSEVVVGDPDGSRNQEVRLDEVAAWAPVQGPAESVAEPIE